jgi:hypothetical protein
MIKHRILILLIMIMCLQIIRLEIITIGRDIFQVEEMKMF